MAEDAHLPSIIDLWIACPGTEVKTNLSPNFKIGKHTDCNFTLKQPTTADPYEEKSLNHVSRFHLTINEDGKLVDTSTNGTLVIYPDGRALTLTKNTSPAAIEAGMRLQLGGNGGPLLFIGGPEDAIPPREDLIDDYDSDDQDDDEVTKTFQQNGDEPWHPMAYATPQGNNTNQTADPRFQPILEQQEQMKARITSQHAQIIQLRRQVHEHKKVAETLKIHKDLLLYYGDPSRSVPWKMLQTLELNKLIQKLEQLQKTEKNNDSKEELTKFSQQLQQLGRSIVSMQTSLDTISSEQRDKANKHDAVVDLIQTQQNSILNKLETFLSVSNSNSNVNQNPSPPSPSRDISPKVSTVIAKQMIQLKQSVSNLSVAFITFVSVIVFVSLITLGFTTFGSSPNDF